ncbi:hypothetical protein [Sphingomonas sp. UYP23]
MKHLVAIVFSMQACAAAAQVSVSGVPATGASTTTAVLPIAQYGTPHRASAPLLPATPSRTSDTLVKKQTFPKSSSAAASLNLPHGVAPIAPVDGDCWTTKNGMSCRIGDVTIGPFAGAANANTWTGTAAFPILSPNLTAGAYHMYHSMLMGGIDPASLYAAQQAGLAATDALTVGVKSTRSSIHQINGIAAYVDSYRPRPTTPGGDVAGYFQANCHVSGCNVWPINTLAVDTAGLTSQVLTNEFDFNVNAADTVVNGVAVTLTSKVAMNQRGNSFTCSSSGPSKWGSCLISSDGGASYIVYSGTASASNNSQSQLIALKSRTSAGVVGEATIVADANGTLNLASGIQNAGISFRNKDSTEYASVSSKGMATTNDLIVKNQRGTSLFQIHPSASDVNGIVMRSGASGAAPSIAAQGADANIDLNLAPKGTGTVRVGDVSGVSCAAGTVSLATLVVTNGIITHC